MDSNDSISEEEPFDKIDAWFIGPIRLLHKLRNDDSDGAFLAMSASLAMYERFLIKVAQTESNNTEDNRCIIGGKDLGGIGEPSFRIFWGCFRDGLQHQFQPTKKRGTKTYYWNLSNDHEAIPEVIIHDDNSSTIKVNPWKFAELVNQRFQENPQFYEQGKSHKPAIVRSSEESQQTANRDSTFADPQLHPPTQQPTLNKPSYQTRSLESGHFQPAKKSKRPEAE